MAKTRAALLVGAVRLCTIGLFKKGLVDKKYCVVRCPEGESSCLSIVGLRLDACSANGLRIRDPLFKLRQRPCVGFTMPRQTSDSALYTNTFLPTKSSKVLISGSHYALPFTLSPSYEDKPLLSLLLYSIPAYIFNQLSSFTYCLV